MKYYFIGEYNRKPVYYNNEQGLLLEDRLDDLVEPTESEKKIIFNKFGGIKGVELIIEYYKKDEVKK